MNTIDVRDRGRNDRKRKSAREMWAVVGARVATCRHPVHGDASVLYGPQLKQRNLVVIWIVLHSKQMHFKHFLDLRACVCVYACVCMRVCVWLGGFGRGTGCNIPSSPNHRLRMMMNHFGVDRTEHTSAGSKQVRGPETHTMQKNNA